MLRKGEKSLPVRNATVAYLGNSEIKSFGFLRLDSQEDLIVNELWGNSLATGYSSEREAAAGA